MNKYRVGTRKSALAKVQTEQVVSALSDFGLSCEIVEIVSLGDSDRVTPLYQMETPSPGIFTKQLEKALLANEIDLAVHSLKDLPTQLPGGLEVAALSARIASHDCLLVCKDKVSPDLKLQCPERAVVGTSSLRRQAQMLSQRPDVKIVPIRGNVETRIRAVREGKVDAVVLARAGLERLKIALEGVVLVELREEVFVPAPGQGVVAIEARTERETELEEALRKFHNDRSEIETRVERKILRELEGGCTLPLGVRCYAGERDKGLGLKAFLGIEKKVTVGSADWISFNHYDCLEADEVLLVEKTVLHFKSVIEQSG